jgi:hypothetical protein
MSTVWRVGLIVWLLQTSTGVARELTPDDFAFGLPLETPGQAALWQFVLPEEMYRHVVRPDLGDLRVFNALNTIVPHMVRQAAESGGTEPAPVAVPFFPLHVSQTGPSTGQALHISRDEDGRIVEVTSTRTPGTPTQQVTAYLLDLSVLEQSPHGLQLHWQHEESSGFVATVKLESSDDLIHWRTLVRAAALAELRAGDRVLTHQDLPLPSPAATYLRLSWPVQLRRVQLTGIYARFAKTPAGPARQWTQVRSVVHAQERGSYDFESGGSWPVDRAQLTLPGGNVVAEVTLASRAAPDAAWQQRFQGLVYRLQTEATTVRNTPLHFPATTDRFWRLTLRAAEATPGDETPILELGWVPHTLTFVAQGEPPYTLAYGSARVDPPPQPVDRLLRTLDQAEAGTLIQPARPGRPVILGGVEQLRPPPPPLPWKQWLLWGVLLLGVAVLSSMVWRLYRQLSAAPPSA